MELKEMSVSSELFSPENCRSSQCTLTWHKDFIQVKLRQSSNLRSLVRKDGGNASKKHGFRCKNIIRWLNETNQVIMIWGVTDGLQVICSTRSIGIYCTYNWPHFSLYLIHVSRRFHVKFRWEWIKFNPFVSYHAYNVFCLNFRRNLWVLIERKILEAISRKNKGLTTPRTMTKARQKIAQPCTTAHNRASATLRRLTMPRTI